MKIVSLIDLPDEPVSHNPEIKKRVLLKGEDFPTCITTFAQARFKAGQSAGAHAHDHMYEVFLVEQGEGLIRVEGEELQVTAGTCAVVEPGETHDIINSGSVDLVVTYFGMKT